MYFRNDFCRPILKKPNEPQTFLGIQALLMVWISSGEGFRGTVVLSATFTQASPLMRQFSSTHFPVQSFNRTYHAPSKKLRIKYFAECLHAGTSRLILFKGTMVQRVAAQWNYTLAGNCARPRFLNNLFIYS